MANTKVTGDLIASGTITAANLVSGTLDTLLNSYLTTNTYATQGYVTTAVNNLIDAAPASLNTLNELAAALNDDANFATTVTNSLATKLNLSGGTMTGALITTSPLTIQDSTPYIQWKNASGTRLGYIQHNETDLVMSADTGDIGLDANTNVFGNIKSEANEGKLILNSTAANGKQYEFISIDTGNFGLYDGTAYRLWISGNGNVGINTTSPSAKLDILGATQDQLRLRTAGTEHYRIGRDSSDGLLYFYGSQSGYTGYVFSGINGERMRINSSGNVGINCSPSYRLDVRGVSGDSSYGQINISGTGSARNTFYGDNSGIIVLSADEGNVAASSRIQLQVDGSERMRITSAGDVGIGTTNPLLTNPGRGNLTINGSADAILTLGVGGTHKAWFYHTASANTAYVSTVDNLAFESGSAVRMYLASGGNVGINTTSPSQQLHVNGVTLSQGLYIPGLTTLPNVQGAIQADIPSTSYNAFRLRDTATGSSHTIHGFASNWNGGVSPGHLNLEGITAVSFGTWVGPNMIIHHSTGNVGIGIGDSTPDGRLTISAGAENQTAPVNAIRIKGPNVPSGANSSQNISWDFNYAGSAKIRANRGPSWGTQIDFLTNTSSQGSDNPGVKLSILDNGGITFNGDTAAANALDDYEEGTWTPVIRGASTAGTYEISNYLASYIKIGRLVTASGWIRLASSITGGGTAYLKITGLPFAKATNSQFVGPIILEAVDFTADQVCVEFVSTNETSELYLRSTVDNSSGNDVQISSVSANALFNFTISYRST